MHSTGFRDKPAVIEAYGNYRREARAHERADRIDAAWACLEAAHVIGQRVTGLHVGSHLAMLGLAWRTRDLRELRGQATRSIAAAFFTWLWVPTGNSGRANVSAVAAAPIPSDLAGVLEPQRHDHRDTE